MKRTLSIRADIVAAAVAVAVVVAAGSCTPGLAPSEFQSQFDDSLCDLQLACGYTTPSDRDRCKVLGHARTISARRAYSIEQAIADGRLGFDSAAARICLADLAVPNCLVVPASCYAQYIPRVDPGGMCESSIECKAGFCDVLHDGCSGHCYALPARGEPCGSFGACHFPDFCSTSKLCMAQAVAGDACQNELDCSGLWCIDNHCSRATGKLGDPCGLPPLKLPCRADLFCDDSDAAAPTCRAREAVGAPCTARFSCVQGSRCIGLNPADTNSPGVCRAPADVGQPCDPSANPFDGVCLYTCDPVRKTCRSEYGPVGETCATSADCDPQPPGVSPVSVCDPQSHTCVQKTFGDPCDPAANECNDSLCDPATKLCVLSCQ